MKSLLHMWTYLVLVKGGGGRLVATFYSVLNLVNGSSNDKSIKARGGFKKPNTAPSKFANVTNLKKKKKSPNNPAVVASVVVPASTAEAFRKWTFRSLICN